MQRLTIDERALRPTIIRPYAHTIFTTKIARSSIILKGTSLFKTDPRQDLPKNPFYISGYVKDFMVTSILCFA